MDVITLEHLFILDAQVLQHINYVIGTMFFAFSGSYLQETLAIYRGSQKATRLHKIIIGTVIGGLIYLVVQNKYFSNLSITFTTIINVFCGAVGYEIFNRCSSINSMSELANDIHKIIRNIFGIDSLLNSSTKENDTKKKNTEDD